MPTQSPNPRLGPYQEKLGILLRTWQVAGSEIQAPWMSRRPPKSGPIHTAFIGANSPILTTEPPYPTLLYSPGRGDAPAPQHLTAAAGPGLILMSTDQMHDTDTLTFTSYTWVVQYHTSLTLQNRLYTQAQITAPWVPNAVMAVPAPGEYGVVVFAQYQTPTHERLYSHQLQAIVNVP